MRKFKDFISTLKVEIVKLFKKYKARQAHFKHKLGTGDKKLKPKKKKINNKHKPGIPLS